jgi:hypothetical protein
VKRVPAVVDLVRRGQVDAAALQQFGHHRHLESIL